MHLEIGFWVAVGLVAIVAVALFKLIASRLPLRGLQTLAAAV